MLGYVQPGKIRNLKTKKHLCNLKIVITYSTSICVCGCFVALCTPACQNGGRCVDVNKCTCVGGWEGARCQIGEITLTVLLSVHCYNTEILHSACILHTGPIFNLCFNLVKPMR